jgi:hypothetical protein
MHEQKDEDTDGKQDRNGAAQPADQVVEHAPSRNSDSPAI